MSNLAKDYHARSYAAEIAVEQMEEVLANNYNNIKTIPQTKKVTDRGNYLVSVEVEKYNDEYMERKDIIKTVTVNVEYTFRNKKQVYTISTLATK